MTISIGYGGDVRGPKVRQIGTSHFEDSTAAFRYYEPYGLTQEDVMKKFVDGEIDFGVSEEWEKDYYVIRWYLDEDRRYQLEVRVNETASYE
jgi:hypothetical protein